MSICPTMVEGNAKSEYISKIKKVTWWRGGQNKSIYPNGKSCMVEGKRKVLYMPKQSTNHGGEKLLFTKYAQ